MNPITRSCRSAALRLPAVVCVAASLLATDMRLAGGEDADRGLPPEARVVSLEAEPSAIRLERKTDYVQLLVSAELDSGERIDVTRIASAAASPAIVTVSSTGLVRPTGDGQGVITITAGEQSVEVPVECRHVEEPLVVDFVQDVMPVLSKLGCNAGTCHGSKDGKNGFKLSLRGYDPLTDWRGFTDDLAARRINRASSEDSLMLLKATGSVPHGGGQVIPSGSIYFDMIRTWIADGAALDRSSPRVTAIELSPLNPVVARENMQQQMRVLATYADGRVRDVTAEAFVTSGDMDIAEADDQGLLTALRRGEAPVLARYEGRYTATTLTVMGDRSGFVWVQPPVNNYIDDFIYRKLRKTKTSASPLCDDCEFIRRIYLDLTGLPPEPEAVRAFVGDHRETWFKRDELIDKLIHSPEFVDHWTNKWADLLQVNRKFLGSEGAAAFRVWIRGHIEDNTPYDQFVREIITASGSTRENPAASYYKILRDPTPMMENTTHLFLATRFNCNKCHDHPFERWTQDQYYELSAYFARVHLKKDPASGDRKIAGTAVEGAKPLYEIVYEDSAGEVVHERTGVVAAPSFPYENAYQRDDGMSRREELARWLTSAENPYFAMSYVNRVWGYLMGRGIIEPIDDIRAGNPPTHPKLLARLTQQFIDSGFDTRDLIRTICRCRTYQHSVAANAWNEDDQVNYSHALARRLPAEVLYDAVHFVTGSVPRFPGVPPGTRAAQLPDVGIKLPSGFLDKFGRPARESACECERSSDVMLDSVMAMINGPTIADAIADPENELSRLVAQEADDRRLVQELFMRILNREATPEEVEAGVEAIADAGGDYQRLTKLHQANLDALQAYRATLPQKITAWAESKMPPEWHVLDLVEFATTNGAALTKNDDGSWLLTGKTGKAVYSFKATTPLKDITGIRLEVLADDRLPHRGPGRSPDGNFVLSEFTVQAAPIERPEESKPVAFDETEVTFSQNDFSIKKAIDGDREGHGWAVSPQVGRDHVAIFKSGETIKHDSGSILSFELVQQFGNGEFTIGRLRLSATDSKRPLRLPPDEKMLAILRTPATERSDEQQAELLKRFRQDDAQLRELEDAVAVTRRVQANQRLVGAQDLTWALINSAAFLFNR